VTLLRTLATMALAGLCPFHGIDNV